ncbi:tRNA lysidine(34) synthetase TilS [Brevundimonas sp.]|uniref:tRNA lysidine(34) synthetase TilS n=1 Tax=Brevundimonas sp. TaxID=1871086 RepID=UPI002FCB1470
MQLISPSETDGLKARVFRQLSACLDHGKQDQSRQAPVAVGLSGGGDSLALLALVCEWAKAADRPVLALTVDHRLNPASADWTAQAGRMATGLGAEWRALNWMDAAAGSGVQARARQARHGLLADAAREAGATILVLGHTADDAAENHWMRAEGIPVGRLRIWSPSPVWPQGRGISLLRPLLNERRQTLRDYLQQRGLDWIDDPANEDEHYSRVRARTALGGVLPLDRPEIAAPFVWQASSEAETHAGVLRFSRRAMLDAPDRILAMALLCVAGGDVPPRGYRLEQLKARLAAGEDGVAVLSGTRIEMQGDDLTLMREAGEQKRDGLEPQILHANRLTVWDGRFEVRVSGPDWAIMPAKGRLNRLDEKHRRDLVSLPPAARSSLPVFHNIKQDQYVPAWIVAEVRCLVGPRFRVNCLVGADETPQEAALFDLWHGETVPTALFS